MNNTTNTQNQSGLDAANLVTATKMMGCRTCGLMGWDLKLRSK